MSERELSFRELWKMGAYKLPPREEVVHTTASGRVSKPPTYYINEKFVKGSGACKRGDFDETDMKYGPARR